MNIVNVFLRVWIFHILISGYVTLADKSKSSWVTAGYVHSIIKSTFLLINLSAVKCWILAMKFKSTLVL